MCHGFPDTSSNCDLVHLQRILNFENKLCVLTTSRLQGTQLAQIKEVAIIYLAPNHLQRDSRLWKGISLHIV